MRATAVSEAYFRALGATFAAGRAFSRDEDAPNAGSFVVLSHRFWTRRLNADPEIVGKTINLDGVATTVLGVTAMSFAVSDLNVSLLGNAQDLNTPDLWVPLQIGSSTTDLMHFLHVLARLKPGVPLQNARARLAASTKEYGERFPADQEDGWSFTVVGMREAIVENARPILLVLGGAVGLVLLIACANVANLLLVRALSREHEIAIRSALGAGRWRVVRQLTAESVLLALVGGALGVVVGSLGMRWFLSMGTTTLPRLEGAATTLGLDWRVGAFALGVSESSTVLLFGLVPSLVSTRTNLNAIMDSASNRSSGDRRRTRILSLLVTIEVSLAVVLVIGAALLIRTSFALNALDLGFSVDNVLTMRTSLSGPRFQSTADLARTADDVLERVRSIPGVEVGALAYGLPLRDNMVLPFDIVGHENAGPATGVSVAVPGSFQYFDALRIPLLAGRRFDERDVRGAPGVVVINQAMADRYWADGSDPMTARIRIASVVPDAVDEPERQVIGIVGNVRQEGFVSDPGPTMYFPMSQVSDRLTKAMTGQAPMAWIVRTAIDPRGVSPLVQKVVREETGQRVTEIGLMKETWTSSISSQRLNMWLMMVFGTVALLLGAVGIYGVMAYCRAAA